MSNLLLFFEDLDKIGRPDGFCWWRDKEPKFGHNIVVSKGGLVSYVNDVAAYAMSHDRPYILGWKTTSPSVLKQNSLVCREVKSHARRQFETMGEYVDAALYSRVVIESVAVKVAEFRGLPLQGGALR